MVYINQKSIYMKYIKVPFCDEKKMGLWWGRAMSGHHKCHMAFH